jgi:hypothetical protein
VVGGGGGAAMSDGDGGDGYDVSFEPPRRRRW